MTATVTELHSAQWMLAVTAENLKAIAPTLERIGKVMRQADRRGLLETRDQIFRVELLNVRSEITALATHLEKLLDEDVKEVDAHTLVDLEHAVKTMRGAIASLPAVLERLEAALSA